MFILSAYKYNTYKLKWHIATPCKLHHSQQQVDSTCSSEIIINYFTIIIELCNKQKQLKQMKSFKTITYY